MLIQQCYFSVNTGNIVPTQQKKTPTTSVGGDHYRDRFREHRHIISTRSNKLQKWNVITSTKEYFTVNLSRNPYTVILRTLASLTPIPKVVASKIVLSFTLNSDLLICFSFWTIFSVQIYWNSSWEFRLCCDFYL